MTVTSSSLDGHHGYPTPGPQKPTGQAVMDNVFFVTKDREVIVFEETDYDYVIVGSGFCALAFADRMLQNKPDSKILILERGPFFIPEHFQNLSLPYTKTLGGVSETFPWTLSKKMAEGTQGHIRWQHGMVPFFGGRSTLWSAWCPTPTKEEMEGWPAETIEAAAKNFDAAKKLLRVTSAGEIDHDKSKTEKRLLSTKRPVYGKLQECIQKRLDTGKTKVSSVYRAEAAPLACASEEVDRIDFQKFSTLSEILALKDRGHVDIACECVVDHIVEQDGEAIALKTSRKTLYLNGAKLILAMGTLPPATLVRNSFPSAKAPVGEVFSAHFISSIVARVPKEDFESHDEFGDLEIGASYVAGKGPKGYSQQYHIQLSALYDKDPEKNAGTALRYMPDVVATASKTQLKTSEGYVVFVCAVLGELDYNNDNNWFRLNKNDDDKTTNSLLQVIENANDTETWETMDEGTFGVLEQVLASSKDKVEYWHGLPDKGEWKKEQPPIDQRRVPALVHESSTLHLGKDDTAPVDLNYKLKETENVYVTGAGLWPRGGSWNPTMTMMALAQDLADKLHPPATHHSAATNPLR